MSNTTTVQIIDGMGGIAAAFVVEPGQEFRSHLFPVRPGPISLRVNTPSAPTSPPGVCDSTIHFGEDPFESYRPFRCVLPMGHDGYHAANVSADDPRWTDPKGVM